MSGVYKVSLEKIIKDFNLQIAYIPRDPSEIFISSVDVNRPGLQLAGFYDVFDNERVQLLGKSEFVYLDSSMWKLSTPAATPFLPSIPLWSLWPGLTPYPGMLRAAAKYEVPLLITEEETCSFLSGLISELCVELAPRVTRHGVLVEVYGEGILIFGESGVGKSETAIELIKRGHRLIADDAVEIRPGVRPHPGGLFTGEHPPLFGTARYRHHQCAQNIWYGRHQWRRKSWI